MKATETYLILCKMDVGEITLQEAHKKILRLFNVAEPSEQLCPRCESSLIYKRTHTDGYSCSNCFHDWE